MGEGVTERGNMASVRIRKLRAEKAMEPPFCTVCVPCMIHVTLPSPLYTPSSSSPPHLPLPFCPLALIPSHAVCCCCCCCLFDSQLEVEVTSNLCAVICPSSLPFPLPFPRWVHLQIGCNKFLPVCHKTLKTICAK